MRYIATRLHKALELAADDDFLLRCATLPHYVIDKSLSDLLTRGDVRASIDAMIEADIAHLPFPEMLIEIDTGSARSFVVLAEADGAFRASMAVLRGEEAVEVDPDPMTIQLGDAAMEVRTEAGRSHASWMRTAGVCLGIALLMLNIQGVEKEVIEPTRLNRSRVACGKPSIPGHSVMRIGHVYDRNGVRQGFGVGRQMPVHLRAGHARRQHYGENNTLIKTVYIPPVLVNFKPGAEVNQPKRILAA